MAGQPRTFTGEDDEGSAVRLRPPSCSGLSTGPPLPSPNRFQSSGDDAERGFPSSEALRRLDALATLGTVATSVAHEINNPLSYLLASVEVAAARLAALHERARSSGPVDPDLVRALGALRDALEGGERVRALVADVGAVTRGICGTRKLVDVHWVLDAAARIAGAELRQRAEFTREYGPLPPVLASESRLLQVFINILINGAQSIAPGKPRENFVRVKTHTSPLGHAVIEVTDSGAGISAKDMPRIFDPFFTTKQDSGTGLGLCLSRTIVRELGGDISIRSLPGAGTCVAIVLPPATAADLTED